MSEQVYPLFAATGVAVGICVFSLFRNITGNPEVRYVRIRVLATTRPLICLLITS